MRVAVVPGRPEERCTPTRFRRHRRRTLSRRYESCERTSSSSMSKSSSWRCVTGATVPCSAFLDGLETDCDHRFVDVPCVWEHTAHSHIALAPCRPPLCLFVWLCTPDADGRQDVSVEASKADTAHLLDCTWKVAIWKQFRCCIVLASFASSPCWVASFPHFLSRCVPPFFRVNN